jgi:hypothetical protein
MGMTDEQRQDALKKVENILGGEQIVIKDACHTMGLDPAEMDSSGASEFAVMITAGVVAIAENARLRAALEQAGHGHQCAIFPKPGHPDLGLPCNCWKRDALSAAPAEPDYAIGEFGFPIEGPEWERACEESAVRLEEVVRKIQTGETPPPPSPEIAALLDKVIAQKAEPHPDTKRLDWLADNRGLSIAGPSPKGEFVVWDQRQGLVIAGRGQSTREAIDAAMSHQRRKTKG